MDRDTLLGSIVLALGFFYLNSSRLKTFNCEHPMNDIHNEADSDMYSQNNQN